MLNPPKTDDSEDTMDTTNGTNNINGTSGQGGTVTRGDANQMGPPACKLFCIYVGFFGKTFINLNYDYC